MNAYGCPTIHDNEIKLCDSCGKQIPIRGDDFCDECLEEWEGILWTDDYDGDELGSIGE